MSKHTPGPWKWWTSNSTRRLSAGHKDGNVLHAYRCGDGMADIYVSNADALLIAAAPDLLKAIKYARRFLRKEDHDTDYVDAVIAKATGEPQ